MSRQLHQKIVANIVNIKISSRPHAWSPPTDLLETDKEFIVRVELAGLNIDDLTISVENESVTIVGRREIPNKKCAYHRMEIPYGDFLAKVDLPSQVDTTGAAAEYENGFLSIILPKAEPKQVKIKPNKDL
jgi:HSP20 family protein